MQPQATATTRHFSPLSSVLTVRSSVWTSSKVHWTLLLRAQGLIDRVRLVLDSHEHIDQYAIPGTVSCITFNLGYLPGGGHAIATNAATTLPAIAAGLPLLKKGGLMTICIYQGGDTGFEEHDAVLRYLSTLDPKTYLVIASTYLNRPNHPPKPVLVIRLK